MHQLLLPLLYDKKSIRRQKIEDQKTAEKEAAYDMLYRFRSP